ncbi:long-chain fatty acid--CoA ligase [Savagea sp. SN6]|uniref:Long-chain fatty acid--CoA ligase n=1 Tax=Savagea serpentis TaxID=2785297 RepID=A0A8J7GD36_9BACL|nr:long-chain fatty acid--CoA ligase [Savagea serpentis]MBF4501516.1 long-chain fatty acid--CoA ligase [Savagea serpentis]
MMQIPMLLSSFITRAETHFPHKKIVSRTSPDIIHRLTYADFADRTRRLANVLDGLGVERGMKVGSFAWNHHRHLELYFAVPSVGAVLHMINIRLSPEHIIHIVNHAEDEVLFVDDNLFSIIEPLIPELKTVRHIVIMSDDSVIPNANFESMHDYETVLANASSEYEFPTDIDENSAAGMCYTSATTGMPKGVVYSHRGLYLHSFASGLVDSFGISERDVVMPVVPMFHVNAWGLPFTSVLFGSSQVLPGPNFTPELLIDLIESEGVTFTAGVPTVWLSVLKEQEEKPRDLSSLDRVFVGGSASPRGLIKAYQDLGVKYISIYGMTETSPVVSVSRYTSEVENYSEEEKIDLRATQGIPIPGVQTKIVNEHGHVPWDGETMGELMLRGPWITDEYYKDARSEEAFEDGWLRTGDIAVYTKEGYIKIMDRVGDLIKSGGEWISSVDLENALMSLEGVYEAAVVAVPHPKWQERPIASVVLKDGYEANEETKQRLYDGLRERFASWWMPDEILFMDELPKTSVGKFLKAELRKIVFDQVGMKQ